MRFFGVSEIVLTFNCLNVIACLILMSELGIVKKT